MGRSVLAVVLVFFLLALACHQGKRERENPESGTTYFSDNQCFADSLTIGRKGKNKVLATISSFEDGTILLQVTFFKKESGKWAKSSAYADKLRDIDICDVSVSDINGDGYNDVLIKSFLPARGANDVRKLFLYKPNVDDFVFVSNSEDYPNLMWNSHIKTMEASFFSGGFTQVFLELRQDTLYDYAYIYVSDDSVTVEERNENGAYITLRKSLLGKDSLSFGYSNYNPLEIE